MRMWLLKKLINKKTNECLCLRIEHDDRPVLRVCSQLGHESHTSDIFSVVDATMLLKRAFMLPPTNHLIKKTQCDMHFSMLICA